MAFKMAPSEERIRLERLCLRHRSRYMQIWTDALAQGYPSNEARLYAELEIEQLVKNGELENDTGLPLKIDDSLASNILPPNPPNAPKKIPRCHKPICYRCGGEAPCKKSWCRGSIDIEIVDRIPSIEKPKEPEVPPKFPFVYKKIPVPTQKHTYDWRDYPDY